MSYRGLRVAICFPFLPASLEKFRQASPELELLTSERFDQAAIDELAVGGVDGLVAQTLPSAPDPAGRLRWLQVLSAGVDHLLGQREWPGGITLTNARGAYAGCIAQYHLAAILRVAEHADARRQQQRLCRWPDREEPFIGRQLRGQLLVILGYGGIGREIARLARAFGMRVIAVKARPDVRVDDGYRYAGTGDPRGVIPERIVGLDQLAEVGAGADFLSVTLPLTPATRGLVSAAVLAALPPHAWLINTGRGAVVDEAALHDALLARRIGGAVLDVFEHEPLPADSPFWQLSNVVITPHVAGAAAEMELTELVGENLRRFAAGAPLLNRVDPSRGY